MRFPLARWHLALTLLSALLGGPARGADIAEPADLAALFVLQVTPRLELPLQDRDAYVERLRQALHEARITLDRPQWIVQVDRSAAVQALLLWWASDDGGALLIGAAPVSTGRPAGFEHFETPTGVFEHALANPDFRAEGTRNRLGVRGYGRQGMRVFDFGWVTADRGWAAGRQDMRLQMHATDPDRLEPRLGQRESKGCIRIPATLNLFIDRFGLLDADYEAALAAGRKVWVLRADREPTPWPGRYLVVVDSQRLQRPDWSPAPRPAAARGGAVAAAAADGMPC